MADDEGSTEFTFDFKSQKWQEAKEVVQVLTSLAKERSRDRLGLELKQAVQDLLAGARASTSKEADEIWEKVAYLILAFIVEAVGTEDALREVLNEQIWRHDNPPT